MRLVERMGSGIPRIQLEMQTAGLPEPEFHHNGFFQVTLRRPEPYPGCFAEAHRLPPQSLHSTIRQLWAYQNNTQIREAWPEIWQKRLSCRVFGPFATFLSEHPLYA
jgi:Predicted transcriptional regulator containing an HTH domain and an uncharacterized domain shared with the mammalian protein Schlafen